VNPNQFAHEFNRFPKFEGSVASGVNPDGTLNLNSYDRPDDRTEVATSSSIQMQMGDRVLQIAGGDYDTPTAVGMDPWISQ